MPDILADSYVKPMIAATAAETTLQLTPAK